MAIIISHCLDDRRNDGMQWQALQQTTSVVTSKAATCGHFKTGHFGWPRRDCFTVPQVVFARVRLSR
jgi:hypothetical protein